MRGSTGAGAVPATTPPSLTATGTPNPAKPIRPPESSPLSHEIIKRDCGFSVEFSDGNALWIYCDSVDSFQAGFGPHAKEILADIPNYTDLSPVLQISEVVVGQE